MAVVADLLVKISGDSAGLRKELQAAQRQIRSAFGSEAINLSNNILSKFKYVAAAVAGVGIAAVKMNADMQMTTRAFEVLTGSTEKAKTHLSDLERFAASTPFEFAGLTEASKKMQAYGFSVDAVIPIMRVLGDSAMSVGLGQEGIDRITLALGQMNAKGKVSAEEMRQLAETGLPVWEILAKEIGVSVPEAMDKASKGAIDAKTGIGALLTGLDGKFNGMMDKVSGEIPQSFSNMKDSVTSVMRTLGAEITETFDLKNKMADAAKWLGDFAAIAKGSGIREAFEQMVPESVRTAIVGISAAVTGIAVPAFAMWAASVIAATYPLLIIGSIVGVVAALIYENWENVGPFFTALWDTVVSAFKWAWDAISFIADKISAVGNWMIDTVSAMINKVKTLAGIEIATPDTNTKKALVNPETTKKAEKSVWSLKQAIDSLNTSTGDVGKTAKKATDKAAKAAETLRKKQEREHAQLVERAKDTSDRIENEWIQMTKTKMDVLDKWYSDEIKTLNETKAVNENYQRDLTRLEETYSEKRRQILDDEANAKEQTLKTIVNGYASMMSKLHGGDLKGSDKGVFDISQNVKDELKSVLDFFSQINAEFTSGTEKKKADIIAALNETSIAYKVTEQGNLDFSTEIAERRAQIERQGLDSQLEYFRLCKDIQADIEESYNQNSLANLQEVLNKENAMRLQAFEAQKAMMDTYYELWKETHKSWTEEMCNGIMTFRDSLSSALSDLFTGTATLQETLEALGESILRIFADMLAGWIANTIAMALFNAIMPGGNQETQEKLTNIAVVSGAKIGAIGAESAAATAATAATAAAQVAANEAVTAAGLVSITTVTTSLVAAGAAVAAVWAKAAAAVSLASFGANAAPAAAGMTEVATLAQVLFTVPALAKGGYAVGASAAVIGEGRYNEAILPLSNSVFKKLADGISRNSDDTGSTNINIYGDINNSADEKRLLNKLNRKTRFALMGA